MKRITYTLLLSLVASILFLTSCDKTSDEIHECPIICCTFTNEPGEDVLLKRVTEDILVNGAIVYGKYSIKTIVNGIELKGTELKYYPKSQKGFAHINFILEQVLKKFTPQDKQLNIEFLIKFPALFLDEETHSVKCSIRLLLNGNIEYMNYLYFDRDIYQQTEWPNNLWYVKIK